MNNFYPTVCSEVPKPVRPFIVDSVAVFGDSENKYYLPKSSYIKEYTKTDVAWVEKARNEFTEKDDCGICTVAGLVFDTKEQVAMFIGSDSNSEFEAMKQGKSVCLHI